MTIAEFILYLFFIYFVIYNYVFYILYLKNAFYFLKNSLMIFSKYYSALSIEEKL